MLGLSDSMILYHGGYCEVNHPDLAKFCYHYYEGIKAHIFDGTNTEWLHCVVGHRKVNTFPGVVEQMKQYDIIAGKIADDLCIGRLIPERLKDQFCFRTEAGLKCLSFVESEQIWKN